MRRKPSNVLTFRRRRRSVPGLKGSRRLLFGLRTSYGLVGLAAAVVLFAWSSLGTDNWSTDAGSSAIAGRASVIDADTLEIRGKRIRLHAIDAPESAQLCEAGGESYRCGQKAALAMADKIGRQTVYCDPRDTDRYGRIVAVCRAGGDNLNAWLVSEGWALAYRRYGLDYVAHEDRAREARRGVWRGRFIPPWDWRQARRSQPAAPAAVSDGCRIKGNIGRSGDRIYDVPGGEYYDATKISEGKGERWFCSEAEARAAGWRRSRR